MHPDSMGEVTSWVYDYWLSKHQGDLLPARSEMDLAEIMKANPAAHRHISILEVGTDPYRFRYAVISEEVSEAGGQVALGEHVHEVGPLGEAQRQLTSVCETRKPWHRKGPPR